MMSPRAFAWLVRGTVWLAGTGLLALLLAAGVATRADDALYDLNMRHWSYAPGDGVVIVAIDPKSLDELGRWPFPRALHARLIERLDAAGVRAIGMDVTMATPDTAHAQNDRALAAALWQSHRVVMPVSAEPSDLGGTLQETLPVPALAQGAVAFGHVDVDQGVDGVTRGAYLTAGLGRAYWPALALALHRLDHPAGDDARLPGLRNPAPGGASPYLWVRDHYVLLRYAGPAGSFGRVSYVDVLDGRVPAALLKGRVALVGATAEGMGDIIRTPDGLMPGVEYQANMLESLRRGSLLVPLGFSAQFVVGAAMLALPCLLYGLPGLRRVWRATAAGALLALAASLFLLRGPGWWWPPAACVLTLAIALAGWGLLLRWPRRGAPAGSPA
jgi:CHASE2 domain-containing sensor protein